MSAERGFFRKAAIPKGLWVVLGKTALAAASLTLALASASAESEQKHPVAGAARIDQGADKAKLVFDLTAEAKAEAFVLANPDRVIIDLPQIDFAIDPDMGKPANSSPRRADLVASFRFGQLAPGKSRIVIDLSAPALVVRASCEKSQTDDHSRLVIELAKTDRANFRNAVQDARAKLAALAQSNATPNSEPASAKPVIVIDPGHGGIDRGARVKGLVEKELVFDFAKSLAAKLEADGHVTVVLTRDGDSFVTLSERVKMARERNAALFLSIHADTLSEADVAGATVYTVSDRASDAEAARVAEKENESDAVAGLDKTEESAGVSDILFDLTRRETRAYSHFFAHTLVNYWRVAARLNKNPQRSAGFRVLKAPDVPSVLLELGYLSNQKDGMALNSVEWREKTSAKVAEAVKAFFSARETGTSVTKANSDQAQAAKIPDGQTLH
ncbi:N-acetylmuramoyl-L-alanine amidase [Beijerinckiaceae bacterium]|nr:N-acetylmuramoyl-L-alanine amidase [Beijerinckiaceae bacterium]